jgi:DNA-directed RNA polymerase subunit RPC12/RpoP
MAGETTYPEGFGESDVLFDCPECGKSLGIDCRGAGLIVKCPDCGTRMQVPLIDEDLPLEEAETAAAAASPAGDAESAIHRMELNLEELEARRRYLEKLRIDHLARFEKIRLELEVIQSALDRMVDVLQATASERREAD